LNSGKMLATDFHFDLLRFIWETQFAKNICLSPFSIGSTLAMLYGSAGGETKRAIARTMRLEDIPPSEFDLRHRGLLDLWKTKSPGASLQLDIASSLWTGKGFPIRAEFAARAREVFDAETAELDFASSTRNSVRVINSWVREKTRKRISYIIEDVSLMTRLVLANAVYFKGLWSATAKFDRRKTKNEDFYLLDGSRKRVPMMRRLEEQHLAYCRGDDFQATVLPYKDSTVQMALFLPDERNGIDEFLKSLTAESWNRWMREFEPAPGDIVLPRFRLGCIYSLNEVLTALGLGVAFGEQADFSGISPEPLWIDIFRHGTFLEVNEKGTEAAAATMAGLRTLSMPDRFSMIFDHPFFCAICDNKNDEILFAAAVVDPEP
jgi:serine protease inhibitor